MLKNAEMCLVVPTGMMTMKGGTPGGRASRMSWSWVLCNSKRSKNQTEEVHLSEVRSFDSNTQISDPSSANVVPLGSGDRHGSFVSAITRGFTSAWLVAINRCEPGSMKHCE